MVVIGLTGPMGVGKSAVLDRLREKGAECLRADDASRELLAKGSRLLTSVREALGESVFRPDGSLDRAGTAALIFEDPAARARLERVLHGAMVAWLGERIAALRNQPEPAVVVVEAAILTHMGARPLVDMVVRVWAPREVCLQRVRERDGLSAEQAEARMALHDALGLFDEVADWVLDASGTLEQTRERVDELWNELVAG